MGKLHSDDLSSHRNLPIVGIFVVLGECSDCIQRIADLGDLFTDSEDSRSLFG
jgi:hypothetical protein